MMRSILITTLPLMPPSEKALQRSPTAVPMQRMGTRKETNQPSLTRISMRFPAFPKKKPPLFTNGDEEGQFFYLQVFIGIIANVLG
ncbi:hypothetical protein [Desulfobulbus propionicus]|jgi:hypothetical protein